MSNAEAIIAAWEEELRTGCAGLLRDFWQQLRFTSGETLNEQQQLFFELAALDMEFAWKRSAEQPVVPDQRAAAYAKWDLCDAELLARLLAEEFRVRRRFGDRPTRAQFLADSPVKPAMLKAALDLVEQELRKEFRWREGARDAVQPLQVPPFDPRAPLSSADYLVQRFIGAGSSGRVYRARQHSLQRQVALKFLRKSFLRHDAAVDRFLQEARLAGSLRHPGIIAIDGLGRTPGGSYFIAMDLIDGQPLQPLHTKHHAQLRHLLESVAQAAEAMAVAHATGVIHCDLKPANILRDANGRVTLTDFGLARQMIDSHLSPVRGEGTPAWIAPEQVDGCWGPIGPGTDVFNLAATLYWLLSGQSPHRGNSTAALLASAVSGCVIARLNEYEPQLPAALEQLCALGLVKPPSQRLQSMAEFAAELRTIASQLAS
jgi:tRNA A-37 threonylcarbamoyl transferase component Bud32